MSIVAEIFPGQVLALVALFAGDAEVISGAVVVVNVQVTAAASGEPSVPFTVVSSLAV